MENSDKSLKHIEIAALKEVNQTNGAHDIVWCVSPITYHGKWQFFNLFQMISHSCCSVVASQDCHPVEANWLSVVEISSLRCSVNSSVGQQLSTQDAI
jgi:hypothetical protein